MTSCTRVTLSVVEECVGRTTKVPSLLGDACRPDRHGRGAEPCTNTGVHIGRFPASRQARFATLRMTGILLRIGVILLLCSAPLLLLAQNTNITLTAFEDTLKKLGPKILKSKEDREKYNANEKFTEILERALNIENSFDYPFDSLITIARLIAPDKSFRIFNWNLPKLDGTFEYFGFIQAYHKRSKTYKLYPLTESLSQITSPEDQILDHDEWYGAHYYKIILRKQNGKKYYTLLGWDGHDRLSSRKIIDVVYFPRGGRPKFGTPIFKMGKVVKKRVIFEYGSQAMMSVRYDEDNKMIVFDHLSPQNPSLEGQYHYYGPDGSYDALKYKKGKWILLKDFDARNKGKSNKKILQKYNPPK